MKARLERAALVGAGERGFPFAPIQRALSAHIHQGGHRGGAQGRQDTAWLTGEGFPGHVAHPVWLPSLPVTLASLSPPTNPHPGPRTRQGRGSPTTGSLASPETTLGCICAKMRPSMVGLSSPGIPAGSQVREEGLRQERGNLVRPSWCLLQGHCSSSLPQLLNSALEV